MEDQTGPWHLVGSPRHWQVQALNTWERNNRGIVAVVTGAGKTYFALICMINMVHKHPECRFLIAVPTIALLDQWRTVLTRDLGIAEADLSFVGGGFRRKPRARVTIGVLNSLRVLLPDLTRDGKWCLIVDECHHVASEKNRQLLSGRYVATLGLSATPEREYDSWFDEYVVPALGPIIYRYGYDQAHRDGVISQFDLWNVRVPLTADERDQLNELNVKIGREYAKMRRLGDVESPRLKRLLMDRSRASQQVRARLSTTIALMEQFRGRRGIIFHESIECANELGRALIERGHRARVYHSQLGAPTRYENLRLYSVGQVDVLITCRALDEGLDVPDTEFGIIAASTSSYRQRIQRLGRVLRASSRKGKATAVSLYVQEHEAEALRTEAERLEGIAAVRWLEAVRP